ncbi:pectinesterase inhibitor 28-like [Lolium rigidum]|uniref:pectinesterase inhibitor 28-like n=1 Tax=Lolium rigidum TaxID=89674 RepID=UPI001F5CE336|nr:pectinesterase inhibitor 28-like [Lolium rigidum]
MAPTMAITTATLVLLVVFLLAPTALASRSGPSSHHGHGSHAKHSPPPPPPPAPVAPVAAALVRTTCNSTAYYDLCVSSLAADPSSATADVRGLSAIAVSAAASNASASAAALGSNVTAQGGAAVDGTVQALLRTCAVKYGQARDALAAAKVSIAQQDYDYAAVHVSAAAEYPQVCKTLFRRQRPGAYPAELAAREEALNQLCSVALDIISLLSAT